MKENNKSVQKKCDDCLGCNRLLIDSFQGVYRCKNYIQGDKDEQIQK